MYYFKNIPKHAYILFFRISLFPVLLIGCDYSYRHTGQNTFIYNDRILCATLYSIGLSCIFYPHLLSLGTLLVLGFFLLASISLPDSIYLTLFYLRAPPESPGF